MRGGQCTGRLTRLLGVGLLVLLVVGCSRDADEGLPGTGDEGFAAAYTAAAEHYADALDDVQTAGAAAVAEDPVGAAEVYAALRDATEEAHDRFATLRAPGDLTDDLDAVVALFAEQIQALTEAVTAAQARDDRSLETHLARYAELLADWRQAHGALMARLDNV